MKIHTYIYVYVYLLEPQLESTQLYLERISLQGTNMFPFLKTDVTDVLHKQYGSLFLCC